MDRKIEQTIAAAVAAFSSHAPLGGDGFLPDIKGAFAADRPFIEKATLFDSVFDNYPQADSLREVFFDLLLVNFFTGDVKKLEADYLDSPEWEAIEEETIDRGTEMLNLLLYLNECADEGIEPGLGDYLNEFLLVDEDEFQDEHHIYEDVIANQALTESSYEEIAKTAAAIDGDSELKDLFYPMMSFFYEPDPGNAKMESYIRSSRQQAFDHAVYTILLTFKS
jgi:hypothetical protein